MEDCEKMIYDTKEQLDRTIKRKQRIKDCKWYYNEFPNNRISVEKARFQNKSLENFGAKGNKGAIKQTLLMEEN